MSKLVRTAKWYIFERSDDGLLRHPITDFRTDTRFNTWGYDKYDEALDAIEKYGEKWAVYYVMTGHTLEMREL